MMYFDFIFSQIFWIFVTFLLMMMHIRFFIVPRMHKIFQIREHNNRVLESKIQDLKDELKACIVENEQLAISAKKNLTKTIHEMRLNYQNSLTAQKQLMEEEIELILKNYMNENQNVDKNYILQKAKSLSDEISKIYDN